MHFCVFGNGNLVFDSLLVNESDMQIFNPILTIDAEGGSFSFTFPKEHKLWNYPGREAPLFCNRTDCVIITKNGEWLWEGFPNNHEKDLNGDYQITCYGALKYLDNIRYPLSQPLNITYPHGAESGIQFTDRSTFLQYGIAHFTKAITKHYNNRLNDLTKNHYEQQVNLDHQKIYYVDGYSKIEVGSELAPEHFARIVDFESCYEALKKRIADDFIGYYYLTKKIVPRNELADQDNSISEIATGSKEVLLINFKVLSETNIIDNAAVYLGNDLLDFNISEEFELATSVIPRGHAYNDSSDSKWWMKDDHSAFYEIEQKATTQWQHGEYHYVNRAKEGAPKGYAPDANGKERIFLPYKTIRYYNGSEEIVHSDFNLSVVKKYGMREVEVIFDDVVAKYPKTANNVTDEDYGLPLNNPNNFWREGIDYKNGQHVWVDTKDPYDDKKTNHYLYVCQHDHKSSEENNPVPKSEEGQHIGSYYWEQIGAYKTSSDNERMKFITSWKKYGYDGWQSISDYYNAPNEWNPTEYTIPSDWWYIEDYTRALKILGLDYLNNQQFNKLVLEISSNMIKTNDNQPLDIINSFGSQLPVSSDLFGKNLKPYPITKIEIELDDDTDSIITLGGTFTNLTDLINLK